MSSYTTYAVPRVSFVEPLQGIGRGTCVTKLTSKATGDFSPGLRQRYNLHTDLSDSPIFPEDVKHLVRSDVERKVAEEWKQLLVTTVVLSTQRTGAD